MAYTLSGLTSRVQKRIKDTAYSTTDIAEFINDEIRAICTEFDITQMETDTDYTLSIGVQDITNGSGLPTNFDRCTNIRITTDNFEKELKYIDYKKLDSLYPDQSDDTNGVPNYWYKYGNTINVYPAPDIAYAVNMKYQKTPTELTLDADIPDLPQKFEESIVYGGSYRVWEVKDRFDKAAILQRKREKEVMKCVYSGSKKQTAQDTRISLLNIRRK